MILNCVSVPHVPDYARKLGMWLSEEGIDMRKGGHTRISNVASPHFRQFFTK